MPLILASLEYRLGLTRDYCLECGAKLPASVVVNSETVVDVIDVSIQDRARGFALEEFRIVCIERSRTAPPKEPLTEPRAGQP